MKIETVKGLPVMAVLIHALLTSKKYFILGQAIQTSNHTNCNIIM